MFPVTKKSSIFHTHLYTHLYRLIALVAEGLSKPALGRIHSLTPSHTYVDVGPQLDFVLASSCDRTGDEAPMSTTAKRDHGVSSKCPYRPVGTPRSTPRHRHRDSGRHRESWANTRCRPTARASRQCSRSMFHRHISIAAFYLTYEARLVAVSRPCFYRENKRYYNIIFD